MRRGWHYITLGDAASLLTSGSRGWGAYYADHGALFIRMTNLPRDGIRLNLQDLKFVNIPHNNDEGKRTRLQTGDILISITAELGKIGFVDENLTKEAYVNQHVALLRINHPSVFPEYLAYFLSHQSQRKKIEQLNDAGAKAGLNLPSIANFTVSLPPLPEQRKIAAILRTWDEGIAVTGQLIEAKRKKLLHFMEKLLSKCLDFSNIEWPLIKLGSLFTERETINCPNECLLSITGSGGVVERDSLERRDTSSEDKTKYRLICPDDIGYNTMRMWQGVCGLSNLRGIISPAYTVCIPDTKQIFPLFAAFLFKLPRMIYEFRRYSQGLVDDTLGLKFKNFIEIKIHLPPLAFQQKVADFLSIQKQEIEYLKKYQTTLQSQKRGLMQKLLTGEWTVKTEKIEEAA